MGRVLTLEVSWAVSWYFLAISSYFSLATFSALTKRASYLIHSARPSGVFSRKSGSATTGVPISLTLANLLGSSWPLMMNRSGRRAASFSVLTSVVPSPTPKSAT